MEKLEVIEVGNDLGLIFSEDALKRLDCVAGDTVVLTELVHGWHLRKQLVSEVQSSELEDDA